MPPVSKCDTIPRANPNFDWLFTPSVSARTVFRRFEYCDNSNYTFAAPHSCSQELTSKILQSEEDTSGMHHSTSCYSSPETIQISESEMFPAHTNSYSTTKSNSNLFHCNDNVSTPLERTSAIASSLELKPEIHKKEEKLAIRNITMKFLHQIGITIIGRRKHILSNFDMNAISPTSW